MTEREKSFWARAEKCPHENTYPDYSVFISCECGCSEYHCRDCGAYFNTCRCGEEQGLSGWSHRRRENWLQRRSQARVSHD